MSIAFHPAAKAELLVAIEYYESRETGLGASFFAEIDNWLRQVERFPASGAIVRGFEVHNAVRSFVVRRFPCTIVTALIREELVVLAIADTRRAPGYWASRIT